MKFIDVTALSDASPSTDDNQSIGNIELFEAEHQQEAYGTTEWTSSSCRVKKAFCQMIRKI